MDLPELTNRSLELLEWILDQAHERLPEKLDFTSPPEFIWLHARNICDLGKDVLTLETLNRSRASRILIRPMLESLFTLVAAVKHSDFPARKLNAEWKDDIKRIKKWIGKDHLDEFQGVLADAERKIRDVEREHANSEEKEWNPYETAEAADLTQHYRETYYVFSANIHSKISALREHQSNREDVLHSVVLIVLMAVDHIVSAMEIELPQAQIDEKASLAKAAEELIQS